MDTSVGVWVAVIAVAVTMQTVVLIVVAVVAWRAYRSAVDAIDGYRRTELDPLLARARASLDEVHEVAERVRAMDDGVRRAMGRVGARTVDAMSLVRGRSWPAVALIRGLGAVMRSLGSAASGSRRTARHAAD
jgi:HAMP domain-containing protein